MRTITTRRGRWLLRALGFALAVAAALALAPACSSGDGGSASDGTSLPSLIVGSKDITGAQILSQAYGQTLAAKGYPVTYKDDIGPTETVFPLLKEEAIDLYGEFSGTLLRYRGGAPSSDSAATFATVADELAGSGIVAVGPARASDVNAFYVLEETQQRYDLETVSDLVAVAPELVFGGPPECEERSFCLGDRSQQLYGLQFKEVKRLDGGGLVTNAALDEGGIDVAVLFTGSSVIKPNYVLLEDDKGLQPAENPIALVREEKDTPDLNSILESVNAKLDPAAYNEMALKVSIDREAPADVVREWLEREHLI